MGKMRLYSSLLAVLCFTATTGSALASYLPPATAPIATEVFSPKGEISKPSSAHNRSLGHRNAKILGAAIDTSDLQQIKFQEYSIDWTAWIDEVGNQWSRSSDRFESYRKNHKPVLVELTCNADGSLANVFVIQSSGDRNCDEKHVQSLRKCAPLPAFPKGSARKKITLLYVWDLEIKQLRPQYKNVSNQKPIEIIETAGRLM